MKKIKKVYNVKIIAICVALVFSLSTIAYGIDLSRRANLRIPLITADSSRLLEGSQRQKLAIDNLIKKLSSVRNRGDITQLISDISLISDVHYSITECFNKGMPYEAGQIAIEAVKNNIPGVTAEPVTKSISECFNKGMLYEAGQIAIEAVKNNIPGVTAEPVTKSITECFNKGMLYEAGQIAIEAVKNNIPGVTAEPVTKSITECFNKGMSYEAGQIAIEAVKNNIPGVTVELATKWITECFNKGWPSQAGQIAIEAVKNNIPGVTAELAIKWITECFNKRMPYEAGQIAIEAVKNNIPGMRVELVTKSITECFNKGMPYEAGQIAIEAVKNNIPGMTVKLVTKSITKCFNKGMPYEAGQIAIEAVKNNISGVTVELATKWITECFNKVWPSQAGQIAIEAMKNNIPGVTAKPVIKSITECFNKGWPYEAGQIAIEAMKSNISGVTVELVTKSITECFNKDMPYEAGQIAIEAVKNNISGVTVELATKWITECFNKGWPYEAGQIAIEAVKNKSPSKHARQTVNLLRDPAIFIEDGLDLIARIACYALQADRLSDLYTILPLLKQNKHILNMLRALAREEGYDVIIKEIFENKGIDHFVILYNNVYKNIFNNLLPEWLKIVDKRTNLLLRHLVHFDASQFARNDLKFEDIYTGYKEAYTKQQIRPLSEDIPKPCVIEVSTKRAGSVTLDAQSYYNIMIVSIKEALSIIDAGQKGEPLYKGLLERLIKSIYGRTSNLKEKMAESGLSVQAMEDIQQELSILNEARSVMEFLKESNVFPLERLDIIHLKAMSKIKDIGVAIRVMLFIHALENNPNRQSYFREHIKEPVSLVNMAKFIEFVDSFIKPHLLDNLEKNTREILLVNINTKIFKEELDRLSQNKTKFTRRIRLVPLRGWVAEFIGYFSDACWTRTLNIMRDNPDTIALVIVDDDTNELLGGTLLMPNSIKGEKVLIDRGLSPRTEITAGLNVDDFVLKLTDYEEDIARALGATKILVPLRGLAEGLGSNNPDIIQYYERTVKTNPPVKLDVPNIFNGHDITTGKCVVLRDFSLKKMDSILPDRSHSSDL